MLIIAPSRLDPLNVLARPSPRITFAPPNVVRQRARLPNIVSTARVAGGTPFFRARISRAVWRP
jgi:hypothetical protein